MTAFWLTDNRDKINEMEHNRAIKIMVERLLKVARNESQSEDIGISSPWNTIGPKPTTFTRFGTSFVFDEFLINKETNEIFLSLRFNGSNDLDFLFVEEDYNKEIKKYIEDIKTIFGINEKPEVKRFHVMASIEVIHIIYKLSEQTFNDLITSAEMLTYIKKPLN